MEHKELVKQVFIKRNGYNPSDEELDKFMNTGEYLKTKGHDVFYLKRNKKLIFR